MKVITIIFLLGSLFSYSQKPIKADYVFRDACTDSIKILNYSMMNLSEDLKEINSKGRSITLDSAGVYTLCMTIKRGGTVLFYDFMKYYYNSGEYADTLVIPKLLNEVVALHSNTTWYYFCGSLADGKIVEYYPNGKKRCSGLFSKGLASGNLNFYNTKGKLIKQIVYENGQMKDYRFCNRKDDSYFY